MKRFILFGIALVTNCLCSFAYLAPTDRQGDVVLTINGFDEDTTQKALQVRKISLKAPLNFTITAKNDRKETVSGTLRVWMNDDWVITTPAEESISLKPGETRTFSRTAQARDSVLGAFYPIHASFQFTAEGKEIAAHPIALFEIPNHEIRTKKETKQRPLRTKLNAGVIALNAFLPYTTHYERNQKSTALGQDFDGSDPKSGVLWSRCSISAQNGAKNGFLLHPPYKNGAGTVYSDFQIVLPAKKKALFQFSTTLGEIHATEPPSDGGELKVIVIPEKGEKKEVFSRLCTKQTWESASIDLSSYAGETITLRLWASPGPKMNTTCDRFGWGDPTLYIGIEPPEEKALSSLWEERDKTARALAMAALSDGTDARKGQFQLTVQGQPYGIAILPGKAGLIDGVIAFTDGKETLSYRGFTCFVDEQEIRQGHTHLVVQQESDKKSITLTHQYVQPIDDKVLPLRARIYTDACGLKIAWDMPGVTRDARGNPRYTQLALGPGSLPVWRAYAGFGNVIEEPKTFSLGSGGFNLSTRHIGGDYTNGLSLLQATDIFPDRLTCAADKKIYSLVAHHDTTFTFVPSAKNAFAAARAFREISGYKAGPGVKTLLGKMCLDQWGGDYGEAAKKLKLAAKYGMTDAVFVKHVWQRWGYDYRLPEIYPPAGNQADFQAMVAAAKETGILFCPHDNYIDFYPDAEGYSYDHIIFNYDRTPQRAWYNQGRRALSYRWLPHAFRPWMEKNMHLMRDGFQPDSLFIDVFTAIAPMDYYDRAGTFYPKMRTAKEWADAFDTCRNLLKSGAPMISEAGTDALIGSLDAGESDHFGADRWMSTNSFKAFDRTPWHDMVTHGKMILLAGGLGQRYGAVDWKKNGDARLHGYASDDYLCNTVIGGRAPMCDGPFSRRAVTTYWLLHDLCDALARADLETHDFGKTIHQQHTTFDNGAKVWINRGEGANWKLENGRELPRYGFYATAPGIEAGIVMRNRQRVAFAKTEDTTFVDARPPYSASSFTHALTKAVQGKDQGNGTVKISTQWTIYTAFPKYVPFVHICPKDDPDEILFQGALALTNEQKAMTGETSAEITLTFPKQIKPGEYEVYYGCFLPKQGSRLDLIGLSDGARRIKGGSLLYTTRNGKTSCTWTPPASNEDRYEINKDRRMIAFDAIATDGAFRLLHGNSGFFRRIAGAYHDWTLIPLPGSLPFKADISLETYGAKGASVKSVTCIDPFTQQAKVPEWSQEGDLLSLSCDARSFGYRIQFE